MGETIVLQTTSQCLAYIADLMINKPTLFSAAFEGEITVGDTKKPIQLRTV